MYGCFIFDRQIQKPIYGSKKGPGGEVGLLCKFISLKAVKEQDTLSIDGHDLLVLVI